MDLNLIRRNIIGLEKEIDLILYALRERIPVMIEGETGTGKTELAKTVSRTLAQSFYRVDGDPDLTALKLQGWFDPPLVLEKGYSRETFIPGPLAQAMLDGGVFFFNEVNRAPSECLNAVLSALDERLLTVPRLGSLQAENGFVAVLTLNPLDRIATNPLPRAFYDRCIWIRVDHQSLEKAVQIVELRTQEEDQELVTLICRIVEATRQHPQIEYGASVRAAIHMTKLARVMRQVGRDPYELELMTELAIAALTKNIRLKYDSPQKEEGVIGEIVVQILGAKKKTSPLAEVPSPEDEDYRARFISLARKALQAGDLQMLAWLADKNPLLVSQLIEQEGKTFDSVLETGRALLGAQLYKNVRPHLSPRQRERLLKFIIPKVVGEGRSLYERGTRTPVREVRSYKLGEEWDLEASLDQMLALARDRLEYSAIRMRKEKETKRAFVILADQSNSLARYIHYVALATAMLSFALKKEHLAVIGFQTETHVLKGMQQAVSLDLLITEILDLDCGGATDLYKPLEQAQKELGSLASGVKRQAILISDCTPTTGRNPLSLARGFSRLHILYIPPVAFVDSCLIEPLARLETTRIHEIRRFEDIVDHVQAIVSQNDWEHAVI